MARSEWLHSPSAWGRGRFAGESTVAASRPATVSCTLLHDPSPLIRLQPLPPPLLKHMAMLVPSSLSPLRKKQPSLDRKTRQVSWLDTSLRHGTKGHVFPSPALTMPMRDFTEWSSPLETPETSLLARSQASEGCGTSIAPRET